MAKVLTCPACGAPLSLDDDDDGVVECFYCKRHVVVASGSLTQAAATKVVASPGAPPSMPVASPSSPRRLKNPRMFVAALAFGLVAVVVIAVRFVVGSGMLTGTAAAEQPTMEDAIKRLNLNSDQQQAAALFGEKPGSDIIPDRLTISPRAPGVAGVVQLTWGEADKRYISGVSVNYQNGKAPKDVLQKLGGLVPNRLRTGAAPRVSQGDVMLDIRDHGFSIWHSNSIHPPGVDYASCAQRTSALWAVARAAAFDGLAPTPAELELVNGAKLERAGELDTAVSVEQAVDYFQKKYSGGWCRMQAGLLCVVDVDDKLVDSVHYRWPNGLRARVGEARLELIQEKATEKALRAVAGCLEPALGKGQETVVDYVRGTRNWQWQLGDKGDQILLAGRTLVVSTAEGKPLDQPAAWHGKIAKLFSALAACPL